MTASSSIVFMGTAEFGVPALHALHQEFGVQAVVTIPDKASGRGLKLHESAVKMAAQNLGIANIIQPASLRDELFQQQMVDIQPSIMCVIAFRILPSTIYRIATKGAFNVHASLLPKYRGAAPINHAIIQGEKQSGVTSFLLNDVVDTGNILLQKSCAIIDGCTAGELYHQLMPLAAEAAVESVRMLMSSTYQTVQQDENLACPAPKVWRDKCEIDWRMSAREVRNFIHGVSPTPCAWTMFDSQRLKIYRADFCDKKLTAAEWILDDEKWMVGCGDGSLLLTEIQLPNKTTVKAADFVRGFRGAKQGTFVHTDVTKE